MAKCRRCGAKGLFLSLDDSGLCTSCAQIERIEAEKQQRIKDLEQKRALQAKRALDDFRAEYFPISVPNENIQKIWGHWQPGIHDTQEQIERQKDAIWQTIPVLIDSNSQTGVFLSRDFKNIVRTDLLTCECEDFHSSGLPCKHIYRLFRELSHPELSENHRILDIPGSVQEGFNSLSDLEQVDFLNQLRYFPFSSGKQVVANDTVQTEVNAGLFEASDEIDYEPLLQQMTKDEIILALAKKRISGYAPSWSKVRLIAWLIETQPEFLKSRYPNLVHITCPQTVREWAEGVIESVRAYKVVRPDLLRKA